jgi:DNA-binding transcriptional MerR regulator
MTERNGERSRTVSMKYQPKHVQALFSKSPETIRSWSVDFSPFLSVDANPTSGGHRRYTDDDLRVFAHINIRKAEAATNEQISAELTNGQRAEPPREVSAIIAADEKSELALIETLQETIADLREQVAMANTRADRSEGAIQAVTAVLNEAHRAEIERLEKRLADKERGIRELLEENARLKAKG